MRFVRLLLVLPALVCLTGCLSSYTLVKVKADGTGTVEQTTLISPQMVGMLGGMAAGMAGEGGAKAKPPTVADLFKQEELEAAATTMGEGVRFVSSTPASADGREGVKAIYAFDDVTKLTVNASKAPGSTRGAQTSQPPIVFGLAPGAGDTKVLSVTLPDGKKGDEVPAPPRTSKPGAPAMKDMPPEALAMIKSMFQGAKVGIDVEVDGKVVKTNAPSLNGSRVTVMEVDLGQLMDDPAKLQQMQELGPGASFDQVQKTLGGTKGVTLPAERTTTIQFAGK